MCLKCWTHVWLIIFFRALQNVHRVENVLFTYFAYAYYQTRKSNKKLYHFYLQLLMHPENEHQVNILISMAVLFFTIKIFVWKIFLK